MCGIIGIWRKTGDIVAAEVEISRDTMRHRGPDDSGCLLWPEARIGLGHRRLSIIDLSPLGKQPMVTVDGQFAIVFNGEIYNYKELRAELESLGHRFQSQSDTEAILLGYYEWGKRIVSKLIGMFAFAIAERATQKIFIARDRAGEKPLFYFWNGEQFVFASELKAILAIDGIARKIDLEAFNAYLAHGYVPGNKCLLRGAAKLPPGNSLEFQTGDIAVKAYWSIYDYTANDARARSEPELVEEFDALLTDSVRRQLVADVPVGILLSGGVDSSLITSAAARSTRKVKTFTVSFPGNARMDESKHARLIADAFGTEHHELSGMSVTPEVLPKLAAQYDEPIADSSMIPTYLVSGLVRQHCTVALGGDGGDELFGGYRHHAQLLKMQAIADWTPALIGRGVDRISARCLPTGFRGRNYLMSIAAMAAGAVPLPATQFDYTARKRILRGEVWRMIGGHFSPETSRDEVARRFEDNVQRGAGTDFLTYLPDDILVKVDRASMLCSLEIRAPLLDHRIIEFAFQRVPSALKVNGKSKKILAKRLARKLLPPRFDLDRKQGFSLPLEDWLKSSWRNEFRSYINRLPSEIFDLRRVEALWAGPAFLRVNTERLFALALFSLWMNEHQMEF